MRSGGRAAERRRMASPADAPAGAARGLAAWGVWLLGVGNRIKGLRVAVIFYTIYIGLGYLGRFGLE